MRIGEKIKALRLTSGNITKEELAAAVEIPEAKIASYERNLSRPPHQVLLKIGDFFKVPIEFFFEEDDEDFDKSVTSSISKTGADFEEINLAKMTISTKKKKISIAKDSKFKQMVSKQVPGFSENKVPGQRKKPDHPNDVEPSTDKISPIKDMDISLLHKDLLVIKTILNRLVAIASNKPQLNAVTKIERTKDIDLVNKLLKKGYILLELYKDNKGQLGFTLGRR